MTRSNPIHVLFLCTHNSARSILAEALLNHVGGERFKAYSAGSSPRENQKPNPFALQALQNAGVPTAGLHSKSWDVFSTAAPRDPESPTMDLIITVCDNAAGEACPLWTGWPAQAAKAHWGYADPSETQGTDAQKLAAFADTLQLIRVRIERFVQFAGDTTDKPTLQAIAHGLAL